MPKENEKKVEEASSLTAHLAFANETLILGLHEE